MEHIENDEIYKGLSVNRGIPQPPPVSEDAIEAFKKKKRKNYSVSEYVQAILSGNRIVLSQAITLVESALPEHQSIAQEVIEKCLPYAGNSIRIGITGVPGVGKCSFIETLGTALLAVIVIYLTRKTIARLHYLESFLPLCAFCKKVRVEEDKWIPVEEYIQIAIPVNISHGYCPECIEKYYSDFAEDEKKSLIDRRE